MLEIVPFEAAHLPMAADVLNHYVLHSTSTFHTTTFTPEGMAVKVGLNNEKYAPFALFSNGVFAGYGLLMPWKPQEGYRYTNEVTVYLHPEHLDRGIGKRALDYLESVAVSRGITTLIAGVCAENERSVALFRKGGYEQVAFFPRIGYKFDRELDMIYLQKRIG